MWLHVKLTCPLDNLPVDEGLEMLAPEALDATVAGNTDASNCVVLDEAAAPPPSSLDSPPHPPANAPEPPPLGLCFREETDLHVDASAEASADGPAFQTLADMRRNMQTSSDALASSCKKSGG